MQKLTNEMFLLMQVLDGSIIGDGNSWQDEAKNLASICRKMAISLDRIAEGKDRPDFGFEETIQKLIES